MKQHIFLLVALAALGVASSDRNQSIGAESAQVSPAMSFFVTSTGSKTANLGGLRGADKICQELASAVGRLGVPTWLSGTARGLLGAVVHELLRAAEQRSFRGLQQGSCLTEVDLELAIVDA